MIQHMTRLEQAIRALIKLINKQLNQKSLSADVMLEGAADLKFMSMGLWCSPEARSFSRPRLQAMDWRVCSRIR